MLKRRRIITFLCVIMVFTAEIAFQYYGSLHIVQKNTKDFSRAVKMLSRGTDYVDLNSLTHFKWDKLYSFGSCVSLSNMSSIMNIDCDKFDLVKDDGLPCLVFVRDNKVVCCISDNPYDEGFGFNIPTSNDSFTVIPRDEAVIFDVLHRDGFNYLQYSRL